MDEQQKFSRSANPAECHAQTLPMSARRMPVPTSVLNVLCWSQTWRKISSTLALHHPNHCYELASQMSLACQLHAIRSCRSTCRTRQASHKFLPCDLPQVDAKSSHQNTANCGLLESICCEPGSDQARHRAGWAPRYDRQPGADQNRETPICEPAWRQR